MNITRYRALTMVLLASCGQLALRGSATTSGNSTTSSTSPTSPGSPSNDPAPAAAPSGDAHDEFAVKDLKIGMPMEGHAGFTCAKPAPTKDLEDSHCVKFLDSRCSGMATSIGTLRYGEKAPLGCYLDHSSRGTYLDSTLQQTPNTGDASDPRQRNPRKPLSSLHIVGTRSKPSKIYRIVYTFAPDDLTADSKLYTALVAKYGEPSYKNPPIEMRWSRDNTKIDVDCVEARQCELVVDDLKYADVEQRRQEEADQRARHQAAPAPQL